LLTEEIFRPAGTGREVGREQHIVAGIDLELACAAVAVERDRKRIRA
jgi:hypothetical protein